MRFVLLFNLLQRFDVVQGFTFSSDGVFHGLEGSERFAVLGFLVETRADFIFGSGVNLELTDNTLDDVQFPGWQVLADLQILNLSKRKDDICLNFDVVERLLENDQKYSVDEEWRKECINSQSHEPSIMLVML